MFWSTKSVTLLCLASTRRAHAWMTRGVVTKTTTTTTTTRPFTASSAALASAAPPPPTQYMLTYDYIPEVLEKRGPFRAEHLQLAADMAAAGTCIAGGPYAPLQPDGAPPTGALFVFDSMASAQEFVDKDPYVSGGIVTAHHIHAWTVAVSKDD